MPVLTPTQHQRRAFTIKKLTTRETEDGNGKKIGKLTGWLAVYGNVDSYGTVLTRGMFAKSLSEKEVFPFLADHDPTVVIGAFRASEQDHGLFIEADVFLEITAARDKWIATINNAITGLSVGFEPVKWSWDEDGKVLRYTEGKLWEGSLVTFPANELATVETLRSMSANARAKMSPLLGSLAQLQAAAPVVGLAAEGQASALAPALAVLEDAAVKIEALRQELEAVIPAPTEGAAADETDEPPQGHSPEEEADVQEVLRMAENLSTILAPKAQA